jgi:predicted O-methyltransferase YrrM
VRELFRAPSGRPTWFSGAFFGVPDRARLRSAVRAVVACFAPSWREGVYAGDNMLVLSRNLSFLDDPRFLEAVGRHAGTAVERGIVWRTAVLCWAARNALRRPGDLVECGCYRGTSARIVAEVIGLAATERQFWLYDLFEYPEGSTHSRLPELGAGLHEAVVARFADMPQVRISKGRVPEVLAGNAPERISFLHIDMNNAASEIGALEALFDRVSPGGVVVLDDYGYQGYVAQRNAERAWFAARGYEVLELPTSQGLVIK